jgi:hypothetical protein
MNYHTLIAQAAASSDKSGGKTKTGGKRLSLTQINQFMKFPGRNEYLSCGCISVSFVEFGGDLEKDGLFIILESLAKFCHRRYIGRTHEIFVVTVTDGYTTLQANPFVNDDVSNICQYHSRSALCLEQ